MTILNICNPANSNHCINVVYIGFAKSATSVPAPDDKRLVSASVVLMPGESMPIDVIKGFGSFSVHEGQPFVRLLASTPPGAAPAQ